MTNTTIDLTTTTWSWVNTSDRDLVLAAVKASGHAVLEVHFSEQVHGGDHTDYFDLYRLEGEVDIDMLDALATDGMFWGPRSTCFDFPSEYVLDNPNDEVWGDSDFESMNHISYLVRYTLHTA